MNKQVTSMVDQIVESAQKAELPKPVRQVVLDGVSKSQEANARLIGMLKDAGKDCEGLVAKAGAGARAVNDKLLDNAARNTEAVLVNAAAVLKAKDVQTAVAGQFEFARGQIAVVQDQQMELIDLSSKIVSDLFEAATAAANASAERFKSTVG